MSDANARARELAAKHYYGATAVDSATLALLLQYGAEVREACATAAGEEPERPKCNMAVADDIRAVPLP